MNPVSSTDSNYMLVNDESTWPDEVLSCLEKNKDIFLAWEQRHAGQTPHITPDAVSYDAAMRELWDVVSMFHLRGYHCTRLTEDEIQDILNRGMSPQNEQALFERIDKLVDCGSLVPDIARRLKNENQADEEFRAGMIWFCFFEPYKEAQEGIERFFRSWGGEALYNSHEDDPQTGTILSQIGVPCIIEARVPIADNPDSFLETKLVRVFLSNRGFPTNECMDHEGYATTHLPPSSIYRIIRHGEPEFTMLTRSDQWSPPL